MSTEKRLDILESKLGEVKTEHSPSQQLVRERYVKLLVQQRSIPQRLKAAFKKTPKEGPLSLALEALVADVMGEKQPRREGQRAS